jgi:hypothetical protein
MPFDEGKQLLDLIRLGFPFYLLKVHELANVWMSNIRVDTARVLDVKGGRFGDSRDGASAREDAPPEA